MSTPPRVSILMPARNAEDTIEYALQAARSQSVKDVEIIVLVNDSTDQTMEIAQRHAQSDSRIRVIEDSKPGLSRARQRLVEESQAPLLLNLDADDWIPPHHIARGMRIMRSRGLDAIGFTMRNFARSGPLGLSVHAGSPDEVLARALFAPAIPDSGTLVKREAVFATAGYEQDVRLGMDQLMWLDMINAGRRLGASTRCILWRGVYESNMSVGIQHQNFKKEHASYFRERLRSLLPLASKDELDCLVWRKDWPHDWSWGDIEDHLERLGLDRKIARSVPLDGVVASGVVAPDGILRAAFRDSRVFAKLFIHVLRLVYCRLKAIRMPRKLRKAIRGMQAP